MTNNTAMSIGVFVIQLSILWIYTQNDIAFSTVWNNLKSIVVNSSLKFWYNSSLKPSAPGLFEVGNLLMTASISLERIGLFTLFTCS